MKNAIRVLCAKYGFGIPRPRPVDGFAFAYDNNLYHMVLSWEGKLAKQPDGGLKPTAVGPAAEAGGFLETARSETFKWIIGGVLALIGVGLSWLWGWFAAGGPARVLASLPQGAVIAFTTPCPPGWTNYSAANARFIIGAGKTSESTFPTWQQELPTGGVQNLPLTEQAVNHSGGEESHILTVEQIPAHSHRVYRHAAGTEFNKGEANGFVPGAGSGDAGTFTKDTNTTGETGGGKAHPLMPPYLALNYCKQL